MKVINSILLFIFFLLFASIGFSMPFTFDSDNQGWQQAYIGRPAGTTYDQLFDRKQANWDSSNGNPPGSIYQTAQGCNQRAYWMGYIGANSLGDLTGMRLITDIWSTNNWRTIANGSYDDDGSVYARWVISKQDSTDIYGNPLYNMYVSKRNFSININSLSGWETHSIELKEENFLRWPNYDAGTQNFSDLLSNYDNIGLYIFSGSDNLNNYNGGAGTWNSEYNLLHYGAYSNNGQTAIWALDNLKATPVPEPATFLLIGSGLGCIAFLKKRANKNSRAHNAHANH